MIIFETEFIFNEMKFFTDLLAKESITDSERENILNSLNLEDVDYKFHYQKRNNGWYKFCFKGENKISWDDIGNWMRPYIYEFESKNKLFQ